MKYDPQANKEQDKRYNEARKVTRDLVKNATSDGERYFLKEIFDSLLAAFIYRKKKDEDNQIGQN